MHYVFCSISYQQVYFFPNSFLTEFSNFWKIIFSYKKNPIFDYYHKSISILFRGSLNERAASFFIMYLEHLYILPIGRLWKV